jgi:hypothetical protein
MYIYPRFLTMSKETDNILNVNAYIYDWWSGVPDNFSKIFLHMQMIISLCINKDDMKIYVQ